MFIGLALSAVAAAAPAEDGLTLPQPAALPMVSGSGLEGGTLSADTGDSWTHDGAPASVTARSYQLLLDGAPAVTAQPSPSLDIPPGTGGAAYLMQLRVQVAEAPGLWSSWVTIASGVVTVLPRLSAVSAAASGPDGCIAEVSTDTGSGTLYWDVTEEATPPAALKTARSQPVTEAGIQTVTATGLTAGTTYYVHFVQSDGAGHDSAPVSSQAFTTELAAQVPAPFGPQDWSIADAGTGGDAILTIAALPFAGAAALSGIDWRIGSGAWTPLGAVATGTYPLSDGFVDGISADITLRAVNIIGPSTSSDVKTVTTSAGAPDAITIGTASYSPGGGGSGPVLALGDVDLTGTTGPYTVFLATHAGGTVLSKLQIETGAGEARDAVSFTDDDGAVIGQQLTLSTSLTGGRLSVFLRDALGAESAVTTLDGVDVDATAPVLGGIAVSNIAATSVDWEVFTDEAGGTIHVRARQAGAAQWTAAEIIAAPDGSAAGSVLASTAPALYGGATEPGLVALWDAGTVSDGPVATLPDLAGPFDLTAVAAPTASGGVITFDGADDVMTGAALADTGAQLPGARHLRDYTLPDASGGDPGQGFSIAGLAHDDADGTWWAVNGGLNLDGSQADRQQSLVHLSADFSTVLAEIDLDAVMPELDANDESPQAVAVDNANGYLWVGDPTARAIRCFDKATGTRISANDIARGYDIGSLAIAEDGAHIWVMSRGVGDATIQKISTDGNVTVAVDFTVDLDNRHDHLTEKDGLLYVSCGTNGAQAFVVAVDPVQGIALGRAMLPYPDSAEGMVGIEGIQFGPDGSVFIAHNGYFHYGDPDNPVAPLQWPRTNIVAEYTLPSLGRADLDLFALVDATPSGADCALQFGSALDSVKTLPAVGLFLNGALPAIQLRKNHASGGDVANLTHGFDGPVLIYITVRGATVTFFVNGVEAGTDTLGPDGLGAWGPVHPPELGGAHTNANRHTPMDFYAGGLVLGAQADRQVIEGALTHRHGLQSLLPAGHPYKSTAP